MLKFRGSYDRRSGINEIPTVDEVEEILSPMTADTVLQILRGHGIYWGWEIDRTPENEIRNLENLKPLPADTRDRELIRSRRRFRIQKNRLDKFERRLNKAWASIKREKLTQSHRTIVKVLVASGRWSRKDAITAAIVQLGDGQ